MISVYRIQQEAFNFTIFCSLKIPTLWHLKLLCMHHTFFCFENLSHHPLYSISGFESLICFLFNLKIPQKAGLQQFNNLSHQPLQYLALLPESTDFSANSQFSGSSGDSELSLTSINPTPELSAGMQVSAGEATFHGF